MFDPAAFVACVTDGLKERGFGHKRIKELTDDFKSRMDVRIADGQDTASAGQLAMKELFEDLSRASAERAKRNAKMLATQGDNIRRVNAGKTAKVGVAASVGKKGSRGAAVARAAISTVESDPRFPGQSYNSNKDTIRGQLYAIFNDTLETVGKGAFGRQKGKAHLPNIVREIKGVDTGDAHAKAVAEAWLKVSDLTVDLYNAAGGTMNRIERYLPQAQSASKLAKAGEAKWVQMHLNALDWNKTRWPDGRMIEPGEREAVLKQVYATLSTDGANKVDITAFRGRGKAVGNMIDNHRFMHYKDAESWLKMHEEFGDGNVFEVLTRHVEDMSHRIALIETYGPNPEATRMNLHSIVRKAASEFGPKAVADADAVMKNTFDPMFETIMRENPMDPNSGFGAGVTGVGNLLTAAQLGSASFLAIPGDFVQSAAVRSLNNMGLFNGVGTYIRTLATDQKFMREIATQSGFVMDEVVMSTYAASRFTGIATVGPSATRHVSEATMRLSLLSGHTRSARWAAQSEFMGLMNRMKSTAYEDLPFVQVLQRYNISKAEWDAFRNGVQPWEPRKGARFLRPIDVLKSDVPNKQALYRKFQGMIYDEARYMVPEATIEGAVKLRDTTRPDTLVGAILYSFAMYKNFPISFAMIYGRLGLSAPSAAKRLGFYAALGAGMTLVGAVGTQLREMSKGRDPLPMDDPAFLGKAFLSGGALSIWGDFLFAGVNEYGRGPQDLVAGPVIGALGDTTNLAFGGLFQWAENVGSLSEPGTQSTFAAKSVEWARRYTPGTSIWWARVALERQVFDRLQELADPRAYSKWQSRQRRQLKERGNAYWWAPGTDAPQRAPRYGG